MKLTEIKSKELRMKDFPKLDEKALEKEIEQLKSDLEFARIHVAALQHDKTLHAKWSKKHAEAFKLWEAAIKKSVAYEKYNKAIAELARFLEK
jgi:hypothetical protein